VSQQVTLRQWTDVVRRARLGRTVKAVAMVLATYADSDGTRVFPGIARLSYECELGYNVTQNALAKLRDAQLIALVKKASRRGDADEYRLILGEELLERIEVPTPGQVEVAINAIRGAKHGRHKPNLHPTALGADDAETADLHPTGMGADERPAPNGMGSETQPAPNGVVHLHPTPLGPTAHYLDTTATAHSDEEVVTTSHGPRASDAEADPDFAAEVKARQLTLAPPRCAHGLKGGKRADGQPHCAICRNVPAIAEAFIPGPRGAPA
jgi:hypothetical protein